MYEIYRVTNLVNGKKYIGQTKQGFEKRWRSHVCTSRYESKGTYFTRSIRKHGEENFSVDIIETVETLEQSNASEKKWIAFYDTTDHEKGYNCTFGGDGSSPTPETCEKISFARLELYKDPEFKAAMSVANTGKNHTETGRANIAKALQGNQYRAGKPHDEASKLKISESLKRAFMEGRRKKTGGLKKGTILGPMSEEYKKKISDGMKLARALHPWSTRKKTEKVGTNDLP